jgi:hypothetical protein
VIRVAKVRSVRRARNWPLQGRAEEFAARSHGLKIPRPAGLPFLKMQARKPALHECTTGCRIPHM